MINFPDLHFGNYMHTKSGMSYHALNLPIIEIYHFLKNRKAVSAVYRMSRLQTTRPLAYDNICLVFQANQMPNDIRV